jgi:AraC family transcriptional regulator
MTSHIQLVERQRVIGLDGSPWDPVPVNTWTGMPFEVHRHMRQGEVSQRYNPNPLIFLRRGANGRSRIVSGSRTIDLKVGSGQIDIYGASFQMDHGSWDCTPGQLMALELTRSSMRNLLSAESEHFSLKTVLCGYDLVLAKLIVCIKSEIDDGCPSGGLFADGLCLALLGYLQSHYATSKSTAPPRHRLSRAQMKTLTEFIETRLGSDLRVAELAALVELTPHYLTRLFRNSFGMTPHRYVLQQRLEAAKRMLRTNAAIADVAYSLGFSSQAHFTQAFRRYTGSTPARLRGDNI